MSKKGENIHKRKDGRWEGRYKKGYTDKGKIIYGSVYGKNYRETKDKLRMAIATLDSSVTSSKPSNLLFSDAVQLWINNSAMKLKGGTKKKYFQLLQTHILPELGNISLQEINATFVNTFLNNKLEYGRLDGKGGLSPSYVRSISLIVSSVLSYAANEELCKPLKSLINKPSIGKKELTVLSIDDQRRLERHIETDLTGTNVGIMISLYTGLRIGEVCALNWKDINLNKKTLFVRHTVGMVHIENHQIRTIYHHAIPRLKSSLRVDVAGSIRGNFY